MNWKAELNQMLLIEDAVVREKAVLAWWSMRSETEKTAIANDFQIIFITIETMWAILADELGELTEAVVENGRRLWDGLPELRHYAAALEAHHAKVWNIPENRDGAAATSE